MKIAYVQNMRLPTEKAHGYQIAKMCEAFALNGHSVTLVVPDRKNPLNEDVYAYYDTAKNFEVKKLPTIDALAWPGPRGLAFTINSVAFFLSCWLHRPEKGAVIFTRTPEIAWLFAVRGYRTIFECHQLPNRLRRIYRFLIKNAYRVVAITHGLKNELTEQFGYPEGNILVAPDGVDLGTFDIELTREQARRELGLPTERRIAVYTGQLIEWKGVDTLAEAARMLDGAVDVHFVGGSADQIAKFRSRYTKPNFFNAPNVPREKVAVWLKAADVLVMPNSAKQAISARHTSPLKLFEYMASGTPIVASRLPSVNEILDESMATFAAPDEPPSLKNAILFCLNNQDSRNNALLAKNAVKQFTWKVRAESIINFIQPTNL